MDLYVCFKMIDDFGILGFCMYFTPIHKTLLFPFAKKLILFFSITPLFANLKSFRFLFSHLDL